MSLRSILLRSAAATATFAGLAAARAGDAAQPAALGAERLRATVEFLASDAMAGRDTPSPELTEAARVLADRFRAAGLEPAGSSFVLEYPLAARVLDSAALEVVVRQDGTEVRLEPDRDVRWYSGSGPCAAPEGALERVPAAEARESKLLAARDRSEPVLVEVDEESPLWRKCAGARPVLARGRAGAPVLLLRKGVLLDGPVLASVRVPAAAETEVRVPNVVAVLRGATRPGEYVVFSAHFDHIGVGFPAGGDSVFNGADDDASGTAGVVHLAEAFAAGGERPARSLLFVCFSGEERGLLGSRAFAEAPPVPLDAIVANLNLEMIGRPPEGGRFQAWLTGPGYSDLADRVRPALAQAGVELVAFEHQDRLFFASDNASLAARGVVAHSLSAGSLHDDYHQVSDSADKIDVEHMERVLHGVYEAGRALAAAADRPGFTDDGRQRLAARDRRRPPVTANAVLFEQASGDFTRYELLDPAAGTFRIEYDVAATAEGARSFWNHIRPGSAASDVAVTERASGRALEWELQDGVAARAAGFAEAEPEGRYIRVELAAPVPKGGATRLRIAKTYADPASFRSDGERIVFRRELSIPRNTIVLPAGYALESCGVPVQLGRSGDGRLWVSFLHPGPGAADLELAARPLGEAGRAELARAVADLEPAREAVEQAVAFAVVERAAEARSIAYFLQEPESHSFRLYHDFTESRAGAGHYLNVVRKGSRASDPEAWCLDTGASLAVARHNGAEIAALGLSTGPEPLAADAEVVLVRFPPVPEGGSSRIRVAETYTDAERYFVRDGELVWNRTFGRAENAVILPAGWFATACSAPAAVSTLADGRLRLDFRNGRPDDVRVMIRARRR